MKRCELTKVEMTKDRVDHKPSPIRARSYTLYTLLLGNPGYYYFTLVIWCLEFIFHNCMPCRTLVIKS